MKGTPTHGRKNPPASARDVRAESGRGIPAWLTIGAFGAILLLLAPFAFIYFPHSIFPPGPNQWNQGEITLLLQSQPPFLSGQQIRMKAYSSCGGFEVRSGGKKLFEGTSSQEFSFTLPEGDHEITASGNGCSARLNLKVSIRECGAGQSRNCSQGSCGGTQSCAGGIWGFCVLPPRVCPPGAKIGCSTDACSFGYATCNSCGTAFGPCLPPGQEEAPLTGNSISC